MSVTTLTQKISYDGDGTASALAVPFTFDSDSDLVVLEINLTTLAETVMVLDVDYTVAGGSGSTGTVTPAAVIPITVRWLIYRDTSKTQGTSFPAGTRFPAVANETALDRLTRIAQDQGSEIDRTIRISPADSPWTGEIPNATERASKYLAFDANGEPVAAAAPIDTALTTAFTETLLDDSTAAEARATLDAQQDVMTGVGDMVRGGASGAATRLAAGTSGQLIRINGSNIPEAAYIQLPDCNTNFRFSGMLYGFKLSNSSGTPNTDIDVTFGSCMDSTGAVFMQTIGTITKRLDSSSWVVGTGQPGRAAAATLANNTWYHVFVIMTSSAYGTVDIGFDTSLTAANLLTTSGYTYYRRIGSIKTAVGSNNVVAFVQDGDEFLWPVPILDVDVTNLGGTAVLYPLTVPPGVKVQAIMNVLVGDATPGKIILLSSPDMTDAAPSETVSPLGLVTWPTGGGNGLMTQQGLRLRTDTSKQIRARSDDTNSTLRVVTLGYVDSRGKNT